MIPFRTTIPVHRYGPGTLLTLTWCVAEAVSAFAGLGMLSALLGGWYVYVLMPAVEQRLGAAWLAALAAVCMGLFVLSGSPVSLLTLWISAILGAHLALFGAARLQALVPFFHLFWPVVELPSFPFVLLWFPLAAKFVPSEADFLSRLVALTLAAVFGFGLASSREWWHETQTGRQPQASG